MTLNDIRNANITELKQAILELKEAEREMTLGEFHATSQTIIARGEALGLSIGDLNALAQGKELDGEVAK